MERTCLGGLLGVSSPGLRGARRLAPSQDRVAAYHNVQAVGELLILLAVILFLLVVFIILVVVFIVVLVTDFFPLVVDAFVVRIFILLVLVHIPFVFFVLVVSIPDHNGNRLRWAPILA